MSYRARESVDRIDALIPILDAILLYRQSSLVRVSNEWLTFVRPHITPLHNYKILYQSRFPIRLLCLWFRTLVHLSVFLFRSLLISFNPNSLPSEQSDCILVSHLVSRRSIETDSDFYYDRIQEMLVNAGLRLQTLYINHLSNSDSDSCHSSTLNKYILPRTPPLSLALHALRQSISDVLLLSRQAFAEPNPLLARGFLVAAAANLAPATLTNLARALLIGKTVNLTSARYLFVLHEGHAWERSAIYASRLYSPSLFVFAYQHSALFPYQHSLTRPITKATEPNVVLASGSSSFATLSTYFKNPNNAPGLYLIGSPRFSTTPHKPVELPNQKTILLLPDGTPTECLQFLALSLKLSLDLKDLQFIIRFHPLIDVPKLLATVKSPHYCQTSNLTISSNTLQADISTSSHAIYAGSSSIVSAAVAGLLCIRYDYKPDTYLGDPFALTGYKPPRFSEPSSFDLLLSSFSLFYSSLPLQSFAAKSLYSEFTPEILFPFLS